MPIASSTHVRSKRQPVLASAPTATPISTRSVSGYASVVATASGWPSAAPSAVSNTIAALSAVTASAAIEPSVHSVVGTSRVRARTSASTPAIASTGKSRKPASAGDGIGGASMS